VAFPVPVKGPGIVHSHGEPVFDQDMFAAAGQIVDIVVVLPLAFTILMFLLVKFSVSITCAVHSADRSSNRSWKVMLRQC